MKRGMANRSMLNIWKNLILYVLLYNIIDLLLLDGNILGHGCSGHCDLPFTVILDREEGKIFGQRDYFASLFFQYQWSNNS
jgi:hypothetical protein